MCIYIYTYILYIHIAICIYIDCSQHSLFLGTGYDDFDAPKSKDDEWADAQIPKGGSPDGALRIVAESGPVEAGNTGGGGENTGGEGENTGGGRGAARVRVARAEMGEGTIVKETSEATVLARLEKNLKELEFRVRG